MDDRDALAQVGAYIREFRAASHRLNTAQIGGRWWKLNVPAAVAARWADLGYLPDEAAPLIADEVTPEMAAEADDPTRLAVDLNP